MIKELKTTAARYRLNLLGALDTNNLNCFVRNYETLNAANTIFFFKDLEKRNVTAEKLYLVVDGGRYFHSKEVLYNEYYEKFPDFVQASLDFFKNFKSYKSELETLLTEKIEFVGV